MSSSRTQPSAVESADELTITRIDPVAGAAIGGIDLKHPLGAGTLEAIRAAFLQHQILIFKDQDLTPLQQHAFSLNFGELEGHVIRLDDGKPAPLVHVVNNLDREGRPTAKPFSHGNYFWHTDKSYHDIPSLATMLHARQLPPEGGDTEFANLYLSYEALPTARRRELEGLEVVHSWEASRRNTGNRPATEEEKRERPPVTHPLVRTHPDSGRKLLYIGIHTSHVVGMPEDEGRALLAELLEFCTRSDFVYAHRWQAGDLVMWDNRCLLHRARDNYEMARWPRVLHRTVVRGTRPYF